MPLYDYQEKLVLESAVALMEHKRVITQAPTGSGKSHIFSAICSRYLAKNPGKRVMLLVHRTELMDQTKRTLLIDYGIPNASIRAGMTYIPDASVYVGMVESVKRRTKKIPEIGLLIIDEAHIANFFGILEHYPDTFILGFTATPLSSNKRKPLKMFYKHIVCGPQVKELIDKKRLVQNITIAPKGTVDRLKLAMKGGEFDEQQMGQEFKKPRYVNSTVLAYEQHALNTKTIVFNVNIEHSKAVTEAFVAAGYDCKHLDGYMDMSDRAKIIDWFKKNDHAILCNVGIATIGFDVKDIGTVIMNRSTTSIPLWLQCCGRGSRTYPGKDHFTIIDMGGNAIPLGDWCNDRDWRRVFEHPGLISDKKGVAPSKSCPKCDCIIAAQTMTCPYCGYEFPKKMTAEEAAVHEFVVVTEGISIDAICNNAKRMNFKPYYPFFRIGDEVAKRAASSFKKMDDDTFEVCLNEYIKLATSWAHGEGKKMNKWHKERAREHLMEQIKNKFPKWKSDEKMVAMPPSLTLQNIVSL